MRGLRRLAGLLGAVGLVLALSAPVQAADGTLLNDGRVVSNAQIINQLEQELEQKDQILLQNGQSCSTATMADDGTVSKAIDAKLSLLAPDICRWYATFYGMIGTGTTYTDIQNGVRTTVTTPGMNLLPMFENIALMVIVLAVILSAIRYGVMSNNSGKMFGVVLKAFFATFIVVNSNTIQAYGYEIFMSTYTAAQVASAPATTESMRAATRTFTSNVGVLANFTAAGKGAKIFLGALNFGRNIWGSLTGSKAADDIRKETNEGTGSKFQEKAGQMIVMPFLWGYSVALYLFVITMVLALAALPMAAAAMVATNKSEILIGVIATFFGLVVGVLFLPVAFNVGVNIAYVQPLEMLNKQLDTKIEDFSDDSEKMTAFSKDFKAYQAKMIGDIDSAENRQIGASFDQTMQMFLQSPEGKAYADQEGFLESIWNDASSMFTNGLYGILLTAFGVAVGMAIAVAIPAMAIKAFAGGFGESASGAAKAAGGAAGGSASKMMGAAGGMALGAGAAASKKIDSSKVGTMIGNGGVRTAGAAQAGVDGVRGLGRMAGATMMSPLGGKAGMQGLGKRIGEISKETGTNIRNSREHAGATALARSALQAERKKEAPVEKRAQEIIAGKKAAANPEPPQSRLTTASNMQDAVKQGKS